MNLKPINNNAGHEHAKVQDHLTEGDVLLTRAEAADYLRASVPTLERWARLGIGPDFSLVGRKALYPLPALRRFVGIQLDAD